MSIRSMSAALVAIATIACGLASPATAAETLSHHISTAYNGWMKANGVTNGALAMMRSGKLLGLFQSNRIGAELPQPVASLSKAITAVCIQSLIDDGRLRYNMNLFHLPPDFRKNTEPWADQAIGNITIERLLRHQSRITFDPSQAGLGDVPNAANADVALIRRAFSRRLATGTAERYNNINYAILGLIIQTVTRESYEAYCRRAALVPRGVSKARIGPGVRAMGAYGGWEISAHEYALFARAFDRRLNLLSAAGHNFIDAGSTNARPNAALGVFVVRTNSGRNVFHHGSWQSSATKPQQFSSFFGMWDNGVSVVAVYDRNLSDAARGALDNTLRTAAYGK